MRGESIGRGSGSMNREGEGESIFADASIATRRVDAARVRLINHAMHRVAVRAGQLELNFNWRPLGLGL